jgi:hypothetical protein
MVFAERNALEARLHGDIGAFAGVLPRRTGKIMAFSCGHPKNEPEWPSWTSDRYRQSTKR